MLKNDIENLVEKMRNNPFVRENNFGDVSSFNFTRKAFYGSHWDEQTITARGLFVDTKSNKIVARGYPKFFRYEENGITLEFLKENLVFPLKVYKKENGFLGLFSCRENYPIFATKSQLKDQKYNRIFEAALRNNVSCQALAEMTEYCDKNNCTMLFEVIDQINDPHIIKYEQPCQVILLDVVKNTIDFERMDYVKLYDIAEGFGLPVKKREELIPDFNTFVDFIKKNNPDYSDFSYNYFCEPLGKVEGYVIEDATGYQFKLKTAYYNFWKRMRSVSGSVIKFGRYNKADSFRTNIEKDFYGWLMLNKSNPCVSSFVSKGDMISIARLFCDSLIDEVNCYEH